MKLLLKMTIILIVGIVQEKLYAVVEVQAGKQAVRFVQENIIKLLPQFYRNGILRRVATLPELPGFIIKHDYNARALGAKLLEVSIQDQKLNLLQVPKLWECRIAHTEEIKQYTKINEVYVPLQFCISEYLNQSENRSLSLPDIQQLVKLLTYHTGRIYLDVHSGNLIKTSGGTVGLIDTELRGFSWDNNKNDKLLALNYLLTNNALDVDAQVYLKDYIKDYKNT